VTAHTRTHTDAEALDLIAVVLNTRVWDVAALQAVAEAVRTSGRRVDEVDVASELAQIKLALDALRRASKIEPE
jgi:hypothetical protein